MGEETRTLGEELRKALRDIEQTLRRLAQMEEALQREAEGTWEQGSKAGALVWKGAEDARGALGAALPRLQMLAERGAARFRQGMEGAEGLWSTFAVSPGTAYGENGENDISEAKRAEAAEGFRKEAHPFTLAKQPRENGPSKVRKEAGKEYGEGKNMLQKAAAFFAGKGRGFWRWIQEAMASPGARVSAGDRSDAPISGKVLAQGSELPEGEVPAASSPIFGKETLAKFLAAGNGGVGLSALGGVRETLYRASEGVRAMEDTLGGLEGLAAYMAAEENAAAGSAGSGGRPYFPSGERSLAQGGVDFGRDSAAATPLGRQSAGILTRYMK